MSCRPLWGLGTRVVGLQAFAQRGEKSTYGPSLLVKRDGRSPFSREGWPSSGSPQASAACPRGLAQPRHQECSPAQEARRVRSHAWSYPRDGSAKCSGPLPSLQQQLPPVTCSNTTLSIHKPRASWALRVKGMYVNVGPTDCALPLAGYRGTLGTCLVTTQGEESPSSSQARTLILLLMALGHRSESLQCGEALDAYARVGEQKQGSRAPTMVAMLPVHPHPSPQDLSTPTSATKDNKIITDKRKPSPVPSGISHSSLLAGGGWQLASQKQLEPEFACKLYIPVIPYHPGITQEGSTLVTSHGPESTGHDPDSQED